MTSSTPELEVWAGAVRVAAGEEAVVRGAGDLLVRVTGLPPGRAVTLALGAREVELTAGEDGRAEWRGTGVLGALAGLLRVTAVGREARLVVRPGKLATEAVERLLAELEALAEGMGVDAGGMTTLGEARTREGDVQALDQAVGLAGSAAPAIRRRPIHRAREVVRAVPREHGARTAADARWLATHPVAAARAAATGREVGVRRERRADLDTLENRGVLSTYDRLGDAVHQLAEQVDAERARLLATRPAREAFLTERANLWVERDEPRLAALDRRRARLDALGAEVASMRLRAGLPDLRPRGPRMARTPRVDTEPAYWTTFRAFQLGEQAAAARAAPQPATVGSLDELWEQWCGVRLWQALADRLGPPAGDPVERGWLATLRRGEIARWEEPRRSVTLAYEPEIAWGAGEVRKLFPGRPWRPDFVLTLRWADGTRDVHVFDAKFRLGEGGGPPMQALRELWWSYGEGIGDADGRPLTRSLWALWPGRHSELVAPGMLRADWPVERLRGGAVGLWPGEPATDLDRVVAEVLLRDT